MKTYIGTPTKPPTVVMVDTATGATVKLGGDFDWGVKTSQGGSRLALAILSDLLGSARAVPVYQRFRHRVVQNWKPDQGWKITGPEILEHVKAIDDVYRETAQTRRMIEQAPPPVGFDGGADIEWTKDHRGVLRKG